MKKFEEKINRLGKSARDTPACKELKDHVENFKIIVEKLQELKKCSKLRHWQKIYEITN